MFIKISYSKFINISCSENSQDAHPSSALNGDESANVVTEVATFPHSLVKEGSSVEVGAFWYIKLQLIACYRILTRLNFTVSVIILVYHCSCLFFQALKAPNDKPESSSLQIVCMPKSKTRSKKKVPETHSVALISADKYASCSLMLASVIVAWSPLLQTSEYRIASQDDSCDYCSILAIGGKSGMITFWKINKPQQYSTLNNICINDGQLVGVLHAHMSWVTTMSWEMSVSNVSSHQLLLTTGSSDGR